MSNSNVSVSCSHWGNQAPLFEVYNNALQYCVKNMFFFLFVCYMQVFVFFDAVNLEYNDFIIFIIESVDTTTSITTLI